MATNAEKITIVEDSQQTLLDAAQMIVDATANIQEAQEALNAIAGEHEDNTALTEALGGMASAKSTSGDFHTQIMGANENLQRFQSALGGLSS